MGNEETVPVSALRREAAAVNEQQGVIAFLVGVLAEVQRSESLSEARTCAEMGLQTIQEWHADLWKPGPNDDPADWRKRRP